MKFSKKVLGKLERAYATSIMDINGTTNFFVASEGNAACLSFEDGSTSSKTVWDGPGGTMNIVPIPDRQNEFIATQLFFPTFQAKESVIVHAKLEENDIWKITTIMAIPYLHRFDIFKIENKLFFIGSTLCEGKDFQDDWSKPGKVYVGELNKDVTKPFEIKPLIDDITKNHGFCRGTWHGKKAYLISGSNGVFVVNFPETLNGSWQYEKILDFEVSDIATMDIDGDGVEELATIEGFHGDKGKIYKIIDGKLTPIHEHSYEFGHVVWGGKLCGKPSFIIGGRKGNREVVCFQHNKSTGKIEEYLIDNTGGPSNISVVNKNGKDIILAANREIGEIAIYEITD